MASRRRGVRRAVGVLVVLLTVAGVAVPVAADPPPGAAEPVIADWWDDLLARAEDPGEEYVSPPTEPAESAPPIENTPYEAPEASALPAPGAAEVTLAARGTALQVGDTPVRVAAGASESVGETLRVEVLDQAAASRAGVSGFVFRVAGDDGAALSPVGGKLPVTISADYSGFARRFGGDYAGRLRLVRLPA